MQKQLIIYQNQQKKYQEEIQQCSPCQDDFTNFEDPLIKTEHSASEEEFMSPMNMKHAEEDGNSSQNLAESEGSFIKNMNMSQDVASQNLSQNQNLRQKKEILKVETDEGDEGDEAYDTPQKHNVSPLNADKQQILKINQQENALFSLQASPEITDFYDLDEEVKNRRQRIQSEEQIIIKSSNLQLPRTSNNSDFSNRQKDPNTVSSGKKEKVSSIKKDSIQDIIQNLSRKSSSQQSSDNIVHTSVPKLNLDDSQGLLRKTQSAPLNKKSKIIPALTFDDDSDDQKYLDIEYKMIKEDPIEESKLTPSRHSSSSHHFDVVDFDDNSENSDGGQISVSEQNLQKSSTNHTSDKSQQLMLYQEPKLPDIVMQSQNHVEHFSSQMQSIRHYIDIDRIEFNQEAQEVIVPLKVIYDAKTWAKQNELNQIFSPRNRAQGGKFKYGMVLDEDDTSHQTQLQRLMNQSKMIFNYRKPQLAIENNDPDAAFQGEFKTPQKPKFQKSMTFPPDEKDNQEDQSIEDEGLENGQKDESKFIAFSESSINSKDLLIQDSHQSESQVSVQIKNLQEIETVTSQNNTEVMSEIEPESPLHNILDTGRFHKKFKDITLIGQGGFGKVFRATYHVDQKQYAIKVVRLHILKSNTVDPMKEIYQHRVYRELQAASQINSENIVRYFNSWFEELNPEEKKDELQYRHKFNDAQIRKEKKRIIKMQQNLIKKKEISDSSDSSNPFGQSESIKKQKIQKLLTFSDSSRSSRSSRNSSLRKKKKSSLNFEKMNSSNQKNEITKRMIQSQRRMIVEEQDGEDETDNDFPNDKVIGMDKISLNFNNEKADLLFSKSRKTQHSSGEGQKMQKDAKYLSKKNFRSKSPETTSMSNSLTNKSKSAAKRSASISLVSVSDDSSSENSSSESSSSNDESSDFGSKSSSPSFKRSLKFSSKKSVKLRQSALDEESSDDESSDSESEGDSASNFSLLTLNNFLKNRQQYQSVNMMIQMEYCSGQTLENYLDKRNMKLGFNFVQPRKDKKAPKVGVIDRQHNFEIFTQVINGMAEIHKNNVLHRDLKPENILINKKSGNDPIAKIGDFGLATMLNQSQFDNQDDDIMDGRNPQSKSSSEQKSKRSSDGGSLIGRSSNPYSMQTIVSRFSSIAGTEAYMAPEVKTHFVKGTKPLKHPDVEVNKKQDIYQLGLILYQICHKMKTNMQKNQLFNQLQKNRKFAEQCPLVKDRHIEHQLILHMTELLPENRPSAQDIINVYLPKWKDQIAQERLEFESSQDEHSEVQPLQEPNAPLDPQEELINETDISVKPDNTGNLTKRAEVAHKFFVKK